ncbi:hypothetical protein [Vibrio phage vB_VcM_SY]
MSKWILKSEKLPKSKGIYLTFSSYGVRCAFFDPLWSKKFQDCLTNNDEGMGEWSDDGDEPIYRVSHWMEMPDAPEA